MPADRAVFSLDGTLVVAAGPSGLSLLRVVDGQLVASFATRGGTGILGMVQRPDGKQIAAVSQRSVHIFSMPDLQPADSFRHGAPETSGAATWSQEGIRVGGSDGLTHAGGGSGAAGPVTAVGGFGDHRLAAHGDRVVVWNQNRRVREIEVGSTIREVHVDRDGRYVLAQPTDGGARLYEAKTGQLVFDAGGQSAGASDLAVGGTVMATLLRSGGLRWWDLGRNRAWELAWPAGMALSHGGTWLALITPRGLIKIIEPATGKEAIADPKSTAESPARLLAFVNRRPDLLVVDAENVLSHYDLAQSARDGQRAVGRDVLQFGASPNRIWGITGGKYAAIRVPDGDRCSILFVDLAGQSLVSDVGALDARATVDAENGFILEPARSGAILEREMNGAERRVLRTLPDGQWVAYNSRGLLDNSEGSIGSTRTVPRVSASPA
jgi:hypothetical protein